jgi:hypothetical protein
VFPVRYELNTYLEEIQSLKGSFTLKHTRIWVTQQRCQYPHYTARTGTASGD